VQNDSFDDVFQWLANMQSDPELFEKLRQIEQAMIDCLTPEEIAEIGKPWENGKAVFLEMENES
jgi:predicted Abi (CAAX) family protease